MDGNISKALWIGVSILLFIAVVTIGLSIFGNMKNVTNEANDKIGSIAKGMSEEDYRAYDGKEVKGQDVLSALSNFSGRSGEVIVYVGTMGGNGGNPVALDPSAAPSASFTKYVSDSTATFSVKDKCYILSGTGNLLSSKSKTLLDAERRDSENVNNTGKYINPTGKFQAYLIYDVNLNIRGVIFGQIQ